MATKTRKTCWTCGERYWVRYRTDGRGHDVAIPDPCACNREEPQMPARVASHETRAAMKDRVVALRREGCSRTDALEKVRGEFPDVSLSESNFQQTYWGPAGKVLEDAPAEVVEIPAPVEVKPEPAPAEAVPAAAAPAEMPQVGGGGGFLPDLGFGGHPFNGAGTPAAAAETLVGSHEGVHLTSDADGGWRLQVDLSFSHRDEALRVLCHVFGGLRGQ